jgi:hypothetical protein
MRKLIITALMAVIAVLSVSSVASADVPRCQTAVTSTTTATFSATTPYGVPGDWSRVWTRDYTVTVNPDRTFFGTGVVQRDNGEVFTNETINGKFGDNTVTFTASYAAFGSEAGFSYTLTDAPTDGTTATSPSAPTPAEIGFDMVTKVTAPQFTVATTTTDLNHGQYVSAQGGGKAAAQACVGMPLNSNKIK